MGGGGGDDDGGGSGDGGGGGGNQKVVMVGSVVVISVELDDVRLRRRSIGEVSEKLAVLMRARFNAAP